MMDEVFPGYATYPTSRRVALNRHEGYKKHLGYYLNFCDSCHTSVPSSQHIRQVMIKLEEDGYPKEQRQ